jgi:hypothetical protein
MEQIRLTTKSDPQMKTLSSVIHGGWPNNISDCPHSGISEMNYQLKMVSF